MSRRSLFFRLAAAATILIMLALTLAAFGLRAIFNQQIENRAAEELAQIVKTLAAQVRIEQSGAPVLDVALPDPRFENPYSGIYWQVSRKDRPSLRSRSLWDYELRGIGGDENGERRIAKLEGPNGTQLLAVAQRIVVTSFDKKDVSLQVVAALDRAELSAPQRSFLHLLVLSLAALGIILSLAMAFFIRLALRPFAALADGLNAIHDGKSRRLSGAFPDEVQGVVDDLNRLVAFQDSALERARAQASNLAHGLKTPLAVLSALGRQAASKGDREQAELIEEQVVQMSQQVERVLARARAGVIATLGRKALPVAPVAEKVVRAFARLPERENVVWETEIPPAAIFPGEEGDLTEILGNLLDNARKWTGAWIRVSANTAPDKLTLLIEDDGPGLSPEQASQIGRGRRWDESQPGSGFGLAITRELVEAYQGSLSFERSERGGLRAIVSVPLPTPRK